MVSGFLSIYYFKFNSTAINFNMAFDLFNLLYSFLKETTIVVNLFQAESQFDLNLITIYLKYCQCLLDFQRDSYFIHAYLIFCLSNFYNCCQPIFQSNPFMYSIFFLASHNVQLNTNSSTLLNSSKKSCDLLFEFYHIA